MNEYTQNVLIGLAMLLGCATALYEARGCNADDDRVKIEHAKSIQATAAVCIQSQRPAADCALIVHGTK